MKALVRIASLALLLATIALGSPVETFEQANEAYRNADYKHAISLYRSLLDTGYRTVDVYYNLGNACFKRGDFAHAVLYFERAMMLDPADDIEFNLNVVRSRLRDRVEPVPQLFFVQWWNRIKYAWHLGTIFWISAALFWLLCVGVVTFFWSRSLRFRRLAFFLSSVFLVAWVVWFALFLDAREDRLAHRMAVIMPKEVEVKSSPDKSGVRLFAVHEGLKVEIVDDFDNWYQVRLQDGKKGWVQQDVLERI